MIACAVSVFIKTGIEMSKFEYLSKEIFELEYGVSGAVESKKTKFEKTFSRGITIGVVLCILSLIPMFTAAAFQAPDFVFIICINILLAAVSIAVNIFIRVGSVQDSYNQLLQTGDFTEEGKQTEKFTEKIAGAYWLIVTAVYLACSFYTSDWNKTWIIWPCAGVLFGAIAAIAGIIQSNRQNIK